MPKKNEPNKIANDCLVYLENVNEKAKIRITSYEHAKELGYSEAVLLKSLVRGLDITKNDCDKYFVDKELELSKAENVAPAVVRYTKATPFQLDKAPADYETKTRQKQVAPLTAEQKQLLAFKEACGKQPLEARLKAAKAFIQAGNSSEFAQTLYALDNTAIEAIIEELEKEE